MPENTGFAPDGIGAILRIYLPEIPTRTIHCGEEYASGFDVRFPNSQGS